MSGNSPPSTAPYLHPHSEGGGNSRPHLARSGAPVTETRPRAGLRQWITATGRTVFSLLILGGAVGVFAVLWHGKAPAKQVQQATLKPAVEIVPVVQQDAGITFQVNGVVVPYQEIEVPAEVAGRVAHRSLNCRIGHTVRRGEVLLRIDPQDYELEVRRLEEQQKQTQANLREAQVQIAAAKRQIELAKENLAIKKREVQRYESIDDPGVYSKSELDTARLNELQARDALQTEVDQLETQQAHIESLTSACELVAREIDKAKLDLARTEIKAPIDGVITQEPVEQGNYVQRGGVVAVIQDTSCMEIRCSLRMKEMHWLWQSPAESEGLGDVRQAYRFPKTPVTIVYVMETAKCRWNGELQYYDGAKIDTQTRMVPCRVRVCEPTKVVVEGTSSSQASPPVLMAGMFVTVDVHAKPAIPLLRLPESAIQPGGTVWTVEDNRLHELPIRIAHATPTEAIAYQDETGLKPGDLVVVSPLAAPTENAAVTLREKP